MKLLAIAATLAGLGSAVLASENVVHRDMHGIDLAAHAVTTSTILTTSVLTITKCGTDVSDCSESGTKIVTSVVALTTTICPFNSTSPVVTIPVVTTGSLKPSKPFGSASDTIPPPFPPSFSLSFPTSVPVPTPSTSGAQNTTPAASTGKASSSGDPENTDTDGVPISKPTGSDAYSGPANPPTASGSAPSWEIETISEGIATSLKSSSGAYTPPAPTSGSGNASISVTPTVRITSVVTRTLTSVITAPKSGASNASFVPTTFVTTQIITTVFNTPVTKNTSASSTISGITKSSGTAPVVPSSNIEGISTIWPTAPSSYPSGWPNVTVNGSIILPSPTRSDIPFVDAGDRVIGANANSLMAIVVAFVFALVA